MLLRRGGHWALGLAALVAAALGCSHAPGRWVRVQSDHFRVYSDQRPRDYEMVIERLEDVHDGLKQSFFDNGHTPALEVFLFSQGEFHDLVGDKWGGMFMGE